MISQFYHLHGRRRLAMIWKAKITRTRAKKKRIVHVQAFLFIFLYSFVPNLIKDFTKNFSEKCTWVHKVELHTTFWLRQRRIHVRLCSPITVLIFLLSHFYRHQLEWELNSSLRNLVAELVQLFFVVNVEVKLLCDIHAFFDDFQESFGWLSPFYSLFN